MSPLQSLGLPELQLAHSAVQVGVRRAPWSAPWRKLICFTWVHRAWWTHALLSAARMAMSESRHEQLLGHTGNGFCFVAQQL